MSIPMDERVQTTGGRFLIVYSEGAGGWKSRDERAIIHAFFTGKGLDFEMIPFNRSRQHIDHLRLADRLHPSGNDRLLIAGGDGTIRSVAEHVYRGGLPVTIGILPVGSANLLARVLGIPMNLDRALDHAVSAQPKTVDIGILNKRHVFLLSVCFGRLAKITLKADNYNKKSIGFWAYVAAGARYLFTFPHRLVRLRGSKQHDSSSNAHSLLVFLRHPARALVPGLHARTEGLHALLFHNTTIMGLIQAFADMYVFRWKSDRMSHVASEKLAVDADFKDELHIDGDTIDEHCTSYDVEVKQDAVRFLC